MATKLTTKVSRETAKIISQRPVIISISPAGSQSDALIGFRLKGKRTMYVSLLSDCYRRAALDYGHKLAIAKRAARKAGIPWVRAKKQFARENSI